MVELVRGELTKQQRKMLTALITIDVHARDVVRSMVKEETNTINDFNWTKQVAATATAAAAACSFWCFEGG